MINFLANCQSTAIGSMPHKDKDIEFACNSLIDNLSIPCWVQLPNYSFKENMYIQFSEGFPGVVIDEEKEKIYIDKKLFYEQLEAFLNKDLLPISEEYATGFYLFLDKIKPKKYEYIKGQIIGPVTFSLAVTTEENEVIAYNEEIDEVATEAICKKVKWQIRKLKQISNNLIIFIDEPYLTAIGSSFCNIKEDEVIEKLNRVIDAIHQEAAIAGIHCCGNTNWGLLPRTNAKIISFDAYKYSTNVALYSKGIKEFINRGGILSLGLIPAEEGVLEETKNSMIKKFNERLDILIKCGIEKEILLKRILITPSCGLGTQKEEVANYAIKLTKEVSEELGIVKDKMRATE